LVWRMDNALIQGFESDNANELVSATRDNNILTVAGTEPDNVTAQVINGQAAALYHDGSCAVAAGPKSPPRCPSAKGGTMKICHFSRTDPFTASDVTGGIFNGANVGLLSVHCSYGTTAETDGVKHSYLRFYNYQTRGSSYCRLDDCSFGAPGTNGLKWMAILACSALNNSDYNSMYEFGRLPISNDLHLLLSASTVVTAAPTLGSEWAKNMLGLASTNGAETVAQSWFDAGSRAYIPETNHITITFRVAYWPDALDDYVSDVGGSPGTGNPLDIQKEDETVFSNP